MSHIYEFLPSQLAQFLTEQEKDTLADNAKQWELVISQHADEVQERIRIKRKYVDPYNADPEAADRLADMTAEDAAALTQSETISNALQATMKELRIEKSAIIRELEKRYAESFNGDIERIVSIAAETINAIEKEDFEAYQDRLFNSFMASYNQIYGDSEEEKDLRRSIESDIQDECAKDAWHAEIFLFGSVALQVTALRDYQDQAAIDRLAALAKGRAIQFYKPQSIATTPVKKMPYPMDKPNARIWSWLENADASGQIALAFDVTPSRAKVKKKSADAIIAYSINFSDIDPALTKRLDPFDKRVYVAAGALYNAGNTVFSATQLYAVMTGGKKAPASKQIERLNKSLNKMYATIHIDNIAERTASNGEKVNCDYDGVLLPHERVSAYINGQLCETAIHLFREPPMLTFAKQRKEITSVPIAALQADLNMTENNLAIQDYLIERIGHMKRPHSNVTRKIRYETLFQNCHVNRPDRAKKTINIVLDGFVRAGYISAYTPGKDGVTIDF